MTDEPVRRFTDREIADAYTKFRMAIKGQIVKVDEFVRASDFDRLKDENVRLKGEVDSTNRALMNSGRLLGKNLAEIMILTEERDSLRAEVERLKGYEAALARMRALVRVRDERIKRLEEALTEATAAMRGERGATDQGEAWDQASDILRAALVKGEANE